VAAETSKRPYSLRRVEVPLHGRDSGDQQAVPALTQIAFPVDVHLLWSGLSCAPLVPAVATLREKVAYLHALSLAGHLAEDGARGVAELLLRATRLESLECRMCSLSSPAALHHLLSSLVACNAPLHTLNLSGNIFRLPGARVLAEFVVRCKSLRVLDVTGNQLGDEGLSLIVEALSRRETKLEAFLCSVNAITDASPVCKLLQSTTVELVRLDLVGNDLKANSGKMLAESLERNTSLRELRLARNELGATGCTALVKAEVLRPQACKLRLFDLEKTVGRNVKVKEKLVSMLPSLTLLS